MVLAVTGKMNITCGKHKNKTKPIRHKKPKQNRKQNKAGPPPHLTHTKKLKLHQTDWLGQYIEFHLNRVIDLRENAHRNFDLS